jgi:hypothetical protein
MKTSTKYNRQTRDLFDTAGKTRSESWKLIGLTSDSRPNYGEGVREVSREKSFTRKQHETDQRGGFRALAGFQVV